MSRCIVLTGATASGKTSLARLLELHGYQRIVTYTTRRKRKGEFDGVHYHFISLDEFEKLTAEGFFAETSSNVNGKSKTYYGSAKADYDTEERRVIILDPNGAKALKGKAFIVWLDVPEGILYSRAVSRGDAERDIITRLKHDKIEFEKMRISRCYDMRIRGQSPIEQVVKMIKNEITSRQLRML